MISFVIDDKQEKKLKKWQEKIRKKHGEYGHFNFVFSPTGIGDAIKVYSTIAKETLDLTDLSTW
jgi:hypothetical protein